MGVKPRKRRRRVCSEGHEHRANKHGGLCRGCIKADKAGKHTILCGCCCHEEMVLE